MHLIDVWCMWCSCCEGDKVQATAYQNKVDDALGLGGEVEKKSESGGKASELQDESGVN